MPIRFHILTAVTGLLVLTAMSFGSNGRLVVAIPAAVLAVVCSVILFRWHRATYPSPDAGDDPK
ncbi:hypothetical protein C5B94_03150 [Clavibacter michiganensis]|uniref:Uncharacterized protein n=1 Tax=Clavibacter michiganensis TaxID=28447 RepID=A0A2S5VXF5_9MICO|nr:hypothetical protein [Clavibacter michiganensis]PPF56433.1 hypothetical protein C5B94_03150 [Clavibacter michiganensis]PPF70988.1 hypothetical protein C5E16_01700 [Clavibacter michiganensis]